MKEDPWEYEARTGIKAPFTRDEERLHVETGVRDAEAIQTLRPRIIAALADKQPIPVSAPVKGVLVELNYDYVDGYSAVIAADTGQTHTCRLHDVELA